MLFCLGVFSGKLFASCSFDGCIHVFQNEGDTVNFVQDRYLPTPYPNSKYKC